MRTRTSAILAAALLCTTGATAFTPARAEEKPAAAGSKEREAEKKLLPVGRVGPDFSLPMVGGGEVALANLLKFGKAILVGFWGVEEGGPDLVKLQKLQDELGGKGLTTVTVNPRDDAETIGEFVEEQKVQLQVAIDGKETNRAVTNVYKAKTLPTYYLLDPTGKILYRSVGLREAELREALGKAGVK